MIDLVERYAGIINRDMLIALFGKLTKHLGTKVKAAEQCDLTRKTIDDWEKSGNIKLDTKEKVLEQLIDVIPVETFGYLTKQLYDSSSYSLMSHMSTIYEKSFDANNENEFLQLVNQFENSSKQYAGLIYNKLDAEVSDMKMELENYAQSKGFNWDPQTFHLYDSNQIKTIIPQIINTWVYSTVPLTRKEMAETNKVPLEFVNIVGDTLNTEFFQSSDIKLSEESRQFVNELRQDTELGFYIRTSGSVMLGNSGIIDLKKSRLTLESDTAKPELITP